MVSGGNPTTLLDAGALSPTDSEIAGAGLLQATPQLTQVDNRRKLFAFAALWGLTLDVLEIPGGFVAACRMNFTRPSRFADTTVSGNGFTSAQAVLGCLGEAVEVASWLYRPDDRDRLLESVDTSLPVLSADAVLGFSRAQVRHRRRLNNAWDGFDAIPPLIELREPRFWSKVAGFDGKDEAWCPAFLKFGGFGEIEAGDRTVNADSNGCAAGATMATAQERAVLELVERDSTGIWWWRGCYRDRISPKSFSGSELGSALMEHRDFSDRKVWFLDISAWESAATVAAISCDGDLRRVAVGFAAAFSLYDAARKAFLELIQGELAIEAHGMRREAGQESAQSRTDRALDKWLAAISLSDLGFVLGAEEALVRPKVIGTVEALLDELAANSHTIRFADLERPELGIPVTKALSEGLAHFKPRLGCRRLWAVPEARGWRTMFGGEAAPLPPLLTV
jgi:thiazole/oxazole-forming peptide maturase SagD family component